MSLTYPVGGPRPVYKKKNLVFIYEFLFLWNYAKFWVRCYCSLVFEVYDVFTFGIKQHRRLCFVNLKVLLKRIFKYSWRINLEL